MELYKYKSDFQKLLFPYFSKSIVGWGDFAKRNF